MRIILLKDVAKLGRKGDIKDVADGYARNMLFPMGFAALATSGAVKQLEEEARSKKVQKERAHGELHALKAALAERGIVIRKKADEKGTFYSAVSGSEVLEALRKLNFPLPANLDEKAIIFENPIKSSGQHTAKIVVGGEEISLKIETAKQE